MNFEVAYYDVSYNCLKKCQRKPYEVYKTGNFKLAKQDSIIVSEETGLCVSLKNIVTGAVYYYNDGSLVYTFDPFQQ